LTVFAETVPMLLLLLPAGALADRGDRKRIMLACELARGLGMTSLFAAIALDRLTFAHILVIAVVEGVGYSFFTVAERSSLRAIVPSEQLPAAISQNQAREYAALLAGPPLAGVLFALGRAVPFAVDAVSYLASLVTVRLIRTPLQEERQRDAVRMLREIAEGVAAVWRQPFLRATSLLVTGSDLVINALFLTVIVLAQEQGASSTLIGGMIAFIGIGGLLGAAGAPLLARRASVRAVIVGTMVLEAVLVPLLAVAPHPLVIGAIYGAMFLLHPTWNAVVGAYRIRLVPDRLQGRVQSVSSLLALGAVPIGALVVGVLLEALGAEETVLAIAGVMAIVALASIVSRSVREAPALT
jgi:MFS family permease